MRPLLLLACLFLHLHSFSQVASDSTAVKKSKHLFGFSTGVTSTSLSGTEVDLMMSSDPSAHMASKPGIEMAFVYKYEPINFLYLKTGAGIVKKKSEALGTMFTDPLDVSLNFLNIPLVIGLQPVNAQNAGWGFALETGLAANIDAGSSNGNEGGLHPDNKVSMRTVTPSFLVGANLEIKLSKEMFLVLNYRASKDMKDYYDRVYTWYDWQENKHTQYHFTYRVVSSHITAGLIFTPTKRK